MAIKWVTQPPTPEQAKKILDGYRRALKAKQDQEREQKEKHEANS